MPGRPRGTSQSHPSPTHHEPPTKDSSAFPRPRPPLSLSRRSRLEYTNLHLSIKPRTGLLRSVRTLAAGGGSSYSPAVAVACTVTGAASSAAPTNSRGNGPAHRIHLVPHLNSYCSLRFDPILRDVREGDSPLCIGRFRDCSGMGLTATNEVGCKLAFKSKVVSRAHAETWVITSSSAIPSPIAARSSTTCRRALRL